MREAFVPSELKVRGATRRDAVVIETPNEFPCKEARSASHESILVFERVSGRVGERARERVPTTSAMSTKLPLIAILDPIKRDRRSLEPGSVHTHHQHFDEF